MAGFPMCAACRARVRRSRPTAASTPSRSPARTAVRGSSSLDARRRVATATALRAGPGTRAARRRTRSWRSRGSAATTSPATPRDDAAVAELRRRKRRGDKPFAVMVARPRRRRGGWSTVDDAEAAAAHRPAPADRAAARAGAGAPASPDAVAPGNPDLGVMLPYTPLHVLLFGLRRRGPARRAGDDVRQPLRRADRHRRRRGAGAARARSPTPGCGTTGAIQVPCDDSVARVVGGAELPIRRSRGYAPLPVALPFEVAPVLAVGARPEEHLRAGAPAGTPGSASTSATWTTSPPSTRSTRTERHLEELTGVAPEVLVADAHPGYRSTRVGARARRRPAGPRACSTTTRTSRR